MTDYFHPNEFTRCNPPCKKSDMHPDTIARLNRMREIAGIPLVLNCAYRSPAHDKARGRSGTGAHTLGRAVDIRCYSSDTRYKIITAALEAGFTRIGVADTFVHVDDSPTHAQCVVWTY